MEKVSSHGIIQTVLVPANMTHLLQPLDLTTNAFKKLEKRSFSEYFSSSIMKELEADPSRDVTAIKVDLRVSALKPVHANLMKDIYEHFKTDKCKGIIQAGWKAAGIMEAINSTRLSNKNAVVLNPFM